MKSTEFNFSSKVVLLFIIVATLCISCDQPDIEEKILKLYAPSSLVIEEAGGYETIYFNSSDPWNVVSDQNWCVVSPSSGAAGDGVVTIVVSDNETYDQRNAKLLIENSSSNAISVTVTQKQKDAMLVSSNKVEMSSDAGSFNITLKSNVSFDYEILGSAEEWLSVADTRSMTEHTIGFKVAANESESKRQGCILFKGSGGQIEIVDVYQSGNEVDPEPEEELVLTCNKYIVDSAGEELKIEIRSNVDYDFIMPSVDWMKEIETRSQSTYTHYVVVSPNTAGISRSTYIMVKSRSGAKVEVIEIVQEGITGDSVSITHSKKSFISPEFWGTDVYGNIEWGDGMSTDYKQDLIHVYSSEDEHVVTIDIQGANGLKLKTLNGIKHIDLSNFK